MTTIGRFLRCESGATAIEYGLIAGIIACLMVNAAQRTGSSLSNKFRVIGNALS